ncbi:polyprenyl synthetase family protein, partial [bacterium]|nr:polyprenyl synthetase family protein [bacterium]
MSVVTQSDFFNELDVCVEKLRSHFLSDKYTKRFHPADIESAVTLYIRSGGKRLRPAILFWSCGALGGKVEAATPAAAAVEVFHTWTLVHDDIIDRDDMRRGGSTVHEHFRQIAHQTYSGINQFDASHYGISVAILAGDVQHGWGISMMTELTTEWQLDPMVTIHLINDLDTEVLNKLVEGEVLDIQFSHMPVHDLSVDLIEEMLWKKTGVLYRFCARAGALIGLGRMEREHPHVKALEGFASRCGIAFQLQDDVLGIVGNSAKLGKPVGSDIQEGKRTTVVYYAYENADKDEQNFIAHTLGNPNATETEIRKTADILVNRGGVELTQQRAKKHIDEA